MMAQSDRKRSTNQTWAWVEDMAEDLLPEAMEAVAHLKASSDWTNDHRVTKINLRSHGAGPVPCYLNCRYLKKGASPQNKEGESCLSIPKLYHGPEDTSRPKHWFVAHVSPHAPKSTDDRHKGYAIRPPDDINVDSKCFCMKKCRISFRSDKGRFEGRAFYVDAGDNADTIVLYCFPTIACDNDRSRSISTPDKNKKMKVKTSDTAHSPVGGSGRDTEANTLSSSSDSDDIPVTLMPEDLEFLMADDKSLEPGSDESMDNSLFDHLLEIMWPRNDH